MGSKIYVINSEAGKEWFKRNHCKKKYRGVHIVMMALPSITHVITAITKFGKKFGDRCKQSGEILKAITGNVWVVIDDATILNISNLLKAYKKSKGDERKGAWMSLHNAIKGVMYQFQIASENDRTNAIIIIQSGKFHVKGIAIQQKNVFKVKDGIETGSINLKAGGGGRYSCHDWMYSEDGISWIRLQPTVKCKTKIVGLTPGKYAYFRHELITNKGPQGMSDVIQKMVN